MSSVLSRARSEECRPEVDGGVGGRTGSRVVEGRGMGGGLEMVCGSEDPDRNYGAREEKGVQQLLQQLRSVANG